MKTILLLVVLTFLEIGQCLEPLFTTPKSGSKYYMWYDADTDKVMIRATVKPNTWLGVGLGGSSMLNNDLMVFQAKDSGIVTAMYATSYGPPVADGTQDFTWTMNKMADGYYQFDVVRPLAPSDSNNYAVVLGTEFPFIWAERSTDAEFQKHDDGNNKLMFTLVSEYLIFETSLKNSVYMNYDKTLSKVVIKAYVNSNQWLGIGLGNNKMLNNDLLVFQPKNSQNNGIVTARFTTTYGLPALDEKQDFTWNITTLADGRNKFVVLRPLAPSDEHNFAITLNKEFPMIWAQSSTSSDLSGGHDDADTSIKATMTEGNTPAPPKPDSSKPIFVTPKGGNTLWMKYDHDLDKIVIKANVNNNMYLAIGLGNNKMANTDMILMQGKNEGVVTAMMATSYSPPKADDVQDLTWKMTKFDNGTYQFTILRPLAPTDKNNYAITVGKEFPMLWAE